MAKILFTAVVADMRNKLNGTVFSKNRYGAYTRTKVTPVNPQTDYQQNNRARLGSLSSSWRGLTEAQRQSFIDAAKNFPKFDIFGNAKILSGQALYTELNLNLLNAGQAQITNAPVPGALDPIVLSSVAADVSDTEIILTWSGGVIPAGHSLQVFTTPLYGAGQSFVKNKYRFIQTLAAAVSSGEDIYAAWNARFGTLTAGQKLSVYVKLVSNTTGQAGVPSSAMTIVVA